MKKNNKLLVLAVFLLFSLIVVNQNSLNAQSWQYLGQPTPGMIPERFPPESLLANNSWSWHSTAVFSPDGTEMFFSKFLEPGGKLEMAYLEYSNNNWNGPFIPSFVDTVHSKNCPVFSKGGDSIYYVTTEPPYHILYTTRNGQGWNDPIPVNIPYPPGSFQGLQFSIAHDHSIYFEIWENNQVDLYYSQYNNDTYETPIVLSALNSDYYDWGPFIDYNDNFIIFCSNRPGGFGLNDLYYSTKDNFGEWTEPINLGPQINSSNEDLYPLISFDDLYFFFTTQKTGDIGYNPYWVSSQLIYDIITNIDENIDHTIVEERFEIEQNYPNPFNSYTIINYNIYKPDQISIKFFDVNGIELYTLVDEFRSPGKYSVTLNRKDLSKGIYYYQLRGSNNVQTKKMIIL